MQQTLKNVLKVVPIKLFQDNYSYLLLGSKANTGALVDPADPQVINSFLLQYQHLFISHILYTHHHWDHAGNSEQLKKVIESHNSNVSSEYKLVQYVANEQDAKNIPVVNLKLTEKLQKFELNNIEVSAYHAPCHTKGHSLYSIDLPSTFVTELSENDQNLLKSNKHFDAAKSLFTGDTLFIGGAGRFFEGNAAQMLKNMDYINSLPEDMNIFCGHEYTVANYEWAAKVEINNTQLKQHLEEAKNLIAKEQMTIPSSVLQEKQSNVFMRCRVQELQSLLKVTDPEQLMALLREMKNNGQTYGQQPHI